MLLVCKNFTATFKAFRLICDYFTAINGYKFSTAMKFPTISRYCPFKGTVSRDNLYSIFFIDHILLGLPEVIYGDFKFRRIFAVLFNQKGNSPV